MKIKLYSLINYWLRKKELLMIFTAYLIILGIFFISTFLNNFMHGDFIGYHIPNYAYILNSIKSGVIPLWQPYSYMGLPELFKSELAIFSPLTLLMLLVNLLFNPSVDLNFLGKSMQLLQYSYLLIGALSCYYLLRSKLKLQILSSFLGGFVYSLSIYMTIQIGSMSDTPGRALLPLLILVLLNFIQKSNFKNYLLFVCINIVILSFGYPYNDVYFFIAQFVFALLYGFKKLVLTLTGLLNSVLISLFFLLPNLYIYSQSYRGIISTVTDPFFDTQYAYIPTKLITILNPQIFQTIYSNRDLHQLFSMGMLAWGTFPLVLLIIGLVNYKHNKFNFWIILMLILGLILGMGGYFGVPQTLKIFLPFLEKIRTQSQAICLTFFAGTVLIAQGAENVLERVYNKKTMFFFAELVVGIVVVFTFLPLYCHSCSAGKFDVMVGAARACFLIILSLIFIYLIIKTGKKQFFVLAIVITFLEFGFYFNNVSYDQMNVSYKDFYALNSLIIEKPTNNNLFRYYFLDDQFLYNSSPLKIFSAVGYETVPYPASLNINRLGEDKMYQFSNAKYVVSTDPNKELNSQVLKLVKTIAPMNHPNEIFMASATEPYLTLDTDKNHYIYQVKKYLSRFYVPENVLPCRLSDCYEQENPPNTVYVKNSQITFNSQDVHDVKISVVLYTPNEIVLNTSVRHNTFIASSEVLDSGWKIEVNGHQAALYNVSEGFRGFVVPEGDSRVRMSYSQPYFNYGLIGSVLGMLFLFTTYYTFRWHSYSRFAKIKVKKKN